MVLGWGGKYSFSFYIIVKTFICNVLRKCWLFDTLLWSVGQRHSSLKEGAYRAANINEDRFAYPYQDLLGWQSPY